MGQQQFWSTCPLPVDPQGQGSLEYLQRSRSSSVHYRLYVGSKHQQSENRFQDLISTLLLYQNTFVSINVSIFKARNNLFMHKHLYIKWLWITREKTFLNEYDLNTCNQQ